MSVSRRCHKLDKKKQLKVTQVHGTLFHESPSHCETKGDSHYVVVVAGLWDNPKWICSSNDSIWFWLFSERVLKFIGKSRRHKAMNIEFSPIYWFRLFGEISLSLSLSKNIAGFEASHHEWCWTNVKCLACHCHCLSGEKRSIELN